ESLKEKPKIIIACGGDGTINEVASCLVHSNVIFGIIPMGSGNGLASNLSIPKNILKALKIINNEKTLKIDTGTINDKPFFSNMGIGFDAQVISDFNKTEKRKLWSYFTSVVKTIFHYDYSKEFEIVMNNKKEIIRPFLFFVSNSNEMGYSMSLTPKASLQDGFFDVIIVPKLSFIKMILFTLLLFAKKHYWLQDVSMIKTDTILIRNKDSIGFRFQKDGECIKIRNNSLEIKLHKKSLTVLVH
ncbi:MAG: YegS/Rv2252/BmrU family lipid kinase, partial [Flavobacteriaceae bacterium]